MNAAIYDLFAIHQSEMDSDNSKIAVEVRDRNFYLSK